MCGLFPLPYAFMKTLPTSPLAFARFETRPYFGWAIGAMIAVIIGGTLDGVKNLVLKSLTDAMTTATTNSLNDFGPVWHAAILYTVIFALAGFTWRCSGFFGMRWMTFARTYGYKTLFAYLSHHSANYFNNRFAGALTHKISNVTDGVDRIMQNLLWEFLPLFITFAVGVYTASTANVLFAIILCIWTAVFIGTNMFLVFKKRKLAIAYAEYTSSMRGAMVDSATNIAAVHQGAQQEFEIAHFQTYIKKYERAGLKNWFFSEWILTTGNVLQTIFVILMLMTSISLLQKHLITVGDVVMIIGLVIQMLSQLFAIGNEMNRFMDFYGQAQEGLKELIVPHDIVDVTDAKELKIKEASIHFDAVTFAYGKQNVFENFNLDIPAGQKVGLVGHSGAGKTSLTAMLLRQYEIQGGTILIDKQNIATITQKSLRRHIAIVPQDTSLFHRTIRENIRYGRLDASDEEVERAAKLAQADTFIKLTANGYDTLVGERGVKLSGGQRQRIAIARAILKNAPILVLDEATSALDSESELAIQDALKELMKGKTVLAIAHRLSTLREMDRIVVIEGGSIVEDGSHDELMKKDGVYARLWASQVSGFIQE